MAVPLSNLTYLEQLVEKPTWRSLLIDLILKHNLDPWDIDIDVLAEKYIEKVKQIKLNDFNVPANIILACSILLKFKSMGLYVYEEPNEEEELLQDIEKPKPIITRLPRKRPISLNELLNAIEKAMKSFKYIEKHEKKNFIKKEKVYEVLEITTKDSQSIINEVYNKIINSLDEYSTTSFSNIIENEEKKVIAFLAILFLSSEGKIEIMQEEIFGEIIIKVNNLNQGEINGNKIKAPISY